jgi:arginine/ornithine N-succinyltransferase beta subunit
VIVNQLPDNCEHYLISNGDLENYLVALAPALPQDDGTLLIDAEVQARLNLKEGRTVRYIRMNQASAKMPKAVAA